MTVGIIGIAVNTAGKVIMAKKKEEENIFNQPMLLRNWAVNLIGVLGNPALQQIPNVEKVDELITQFVSDYNEQWEVQQEIGEEE
jgi:Co/Zn/Cd efflux system component